MKRFYLLMALLGYGITVPLVLWVSIDTGNWLFWIDPMETSKNVLANGYTITFTADLFLLLPPVFAWMHQEAKKHAIARPWLYYLITLLFGLGGTLPLFLYIRERQIH